MVLVVFEERWCLVMGTSTVFNSHVWFPLLEGTWCMSGVICGGLQGVAFAYFRWLCFCFGDPQKWAPKWWCSYWCSFKASQNGVPSKTDTPKWDCFGHLGMFLSWFREAYGTLRGHRALADRGNLFGLIA